MERCIRLLNNLVICVILFITFLFSFSYFFLLQLYNFYAIWSRENLHLYLSKLTNLLMFIMKHTDEWNSLFYTRSMQWLYLQMYFSFFFFQIMFAISEHKSLYNPHLLYYFFNSYTTLREREPKAFHFRSTKIVSNTL